MKITFSNATEPNTELGKIDKVIVQNGKPGNKDILIYQAHPHNNILVIDIPVNTKIENR